jgi:hypothetical protein
VSAVRIHRWVLAAVVDEGPVVGPRTYKTAEELLAVVRDEYADLFGSKPESSDFDVGDGTVQLVVAGNSGWYGTRVDVFVEIAGDGAVS